jgi:hypothetical protein
MSKEAMKLAAEFNKRFTSMNGIDVPERVTVPRDEWRALFAALAEQPAQQEPVAWVLLRQDEDGFEPIQFYGGKQKPEGDFKDRFTLRPVCFADASPPAQRTWVGLTHDEYDAICDKHSAMSDFDFLADIEAKLRSKNEDRN